VRPAALGAAAALLLLLASLTWAHARHFHDIETLARQNLAANPRAWSAHAILGLENAKRGELDRAAERFNEALEIFPEYGTARYNLALMHFRQGRLDDAVRELETLVAIDPDYPDAHYSLGVLLNRQGGMEPAIAALRRALAEAETRPAGRRLTPAAVVRLELANSLYLAGGFEEAAQHYRALLEAIDGSEVSSIDPDYVRLSLYLSVWRTGNRDHAAALLTAPSGPPAAADGPAPARAPAPRSLWMERIHAFYRGRITAEDLLRAARESPAAERRERRCEAHFYIGMERLLSGDRDAARRSFEACIDTGVTTYFEYRRAERELERLGG
jgi:lipoprotein NlpI